MIIGERDVLQAWQDGEITYRRAMRLTGAEGLLEMLGRAQELGVRMRMTLTDGEALTVEMATRAIDRAFLREDDGRA